MGSAHSSTLVSRTTGSLDTFVTELGSDIVYDKRCVELLVPYSVNDFLSCFVYHIHSLSSSRFLKTVRCRHRNGYLVVKIYLKPDANALDDRYIRRLRSTSISILSRLSPKGSCRGEEGFAGCPECLCIPGIYGVRQVRVHHLSVGCKQFV